MGDKASRHESLCLQQPVHQPQQTETDPQEPPGWWLDLPNRS